MLSLIVGYFLGIFSMKFVFTFEDSSDDYGILKDVKIIYNNIINIIKKLLLLKKIIIKYFFKHAVNALQSGLKWNTIMI